MKKRIFLFTLFAVCFTLLFAFGAFAVELVTSTSDEFGTVNTIEGLRADTTIQDKTSRVVLKHGTDAYVTFPAYYISDTKLNWDKTVLYKFDALNAAVEELGVSYDMDSIVRLEILSDSEKINQNGGSFQRRANLKEVIFPKDTKITEFPSWLFTGAGLEKIVIPNEITTFGTYVFENCKSLKDVTFEAGFTGTKIPDYTFHGCSSLEEIVLPNTIEELGKNAFYSCSSLQMINFGASFKTMVSRSIWSATKWYIPATFMKDFTGTMDKNFFGDTYQPKVATLYFTGTKEEAEALRAKATHIASWDGIGGMKNARIVEYDPTKADDSYVSDTEWTIVYNYNKCKAFYNNEHQDPTTVVGFEGAEYFTKYQSSTGCQRCKQTTVTDLANALFTYKGFSTDGNSIVYDIRINKDAIKAYNNATGKEIKYGIVASQIFNDGALLDNDGTIVDNRVVSAEFSGSEYSILQIKILNVAEDLKTTPIHCCAYIVDGSKVKYLYDTKDAEGKAVPNAFDVANQVSYSQIG